MTTSIVVAWRDDYGMKWPAPCGRRLEQSLSLSRWKPGHGTDSWRCRATPPDESQPPTRATPLSLSKTFCRASTPYVTRKRSHVTPRSGFATLKPKIWTSISRRTRSVSSEHFLFLYTQLIKYRFTTSYLHHIMGQRHNRKRTRSRPSKPSETITLISNTTTYPATWSPPPISLSSFERPPTSSSSCSESWDPLMAKRIHVFGGDAGDEGGELCAPMLQVVLDLFNGVDYEDDL